MRTFADEVNELKYVIRLNDGRNAADRRFEERVDALMSALYDDIETIARFPVQSVFDLFVIKTLYVERRSRDASVVEYLGGMLSRYLLTRELFPASAGGPTHPVSLSDLWEALQNPASVQSQNLFEAYRGFADSSLFLAGVFQRAFTRPRSRGLTGLSHFITNGKTFYRLASEQDLAELTHLRDTLAKLSAYFEVYVDALTEASQRYILGFDMRVIADKLLDAFNEYRRTGDERMLDRARRYAALLRVDAQTFPGLW